MPDAILHAIHPLAQGRVAMNVGGVASELKLRDLMVEVAEKGAKLAIGGVQKITLPDSFARFEGWGTP